VNGDFAAPPLAIKQAATEGEDGQLTLTPVGGNRYVALNTTHAPFDDINVRKAVLANASRTDLRNTYGGDLSGAVATHFLPPEFPGFEDAGGFDGPDLDYLANPDGDPELAAEYMRKAGFDSGRCDGPDCNIEVIGAASPPGSDTADVVKNQLEQLGFHRQPAEVRRGRHVHEVLQRPGERSRRLPERRLAEGLQRWPIDPRCAVQRREHHPREQPQLAAARRR
jgi:peptide/nickel transport system substrate-binding protein